MQIFPASLDSLGEMLLLVKQVVQDVGFEEVEAVKIELAVEEALVNIISYGYPGTAGNISMECRNLEAKGIQIHLEDQGIPYNPLSNPRAFDLKKPYPGQKDGGYGIFLMLKIMDDVKYERAGESNVLTLVKFRGPVKTHLS